MSHLFGTRSGKRLWARRALLLTLCLSMAMSAGCSRYTVRFLYPKEQNTNFFNDRPALALFVAEPVDLRPSSERRGKGRFLTLRFPADDKLDMPASQIVQRALMQDLLQTRVASLVSNPDNADYVVSTKLTSMTTKLSRPAGAWFFPVAAGLAAGMIAGASTDFSHGFKWGLAGAFLGTFIPAPANTEATVEVMLELRDRATDEIVWSTTCEGTYAKRIRLGLTAREDKKISEEFLPKALKRANACAVGQLYSFFQEQDPTVGR